MRFTGSFIPGWLRYAYHTMRLSWYVSWIIVRLVLVWLPEQHADPKFVGFRLTEDDRINVRRVVDFMRGRLGTRTFFMLIPQAEKRLDFAKYFAGYILWLIIVLPAVIKIIWGIGHG